MMLEDFENYLKEKGYSELTPSGKPSTVYDYKKRVNKICERENINITQLSENISHYVDKYGHKGSESAFGKKSNDSFINALKRFENFIKKENINSSLIINKSLFNSYWTKYKEYFRLPDAEQPEKYKWSVLKQVYDNWNWNSSDKVEMFKNAFSISGPKNLWLGSNFFPIGHTSWMLDNFKTETINEFNNLFNEDLELLDRVNSFISFYDEMLPKLRELVPDKTIKYHSHGDLRAIGIYLSLEYPQKYFLYKYGMVKAFCQKMELPKIKRGKKENLEKYFNISNQVLTFIKEDTPFINEYREFTSKDFNYDDTSLHLLTQDFIYTVANHFEEENEVSFIGHFGVWLDKKTKVFYENLMLQVKTFVDTLIEIGKVDKEQLDILEKNTLKILLKEFKGTQIITDENANYFKDFLNELTMENHNIFELYNEYLIENRSGEIQDSTITNYVNRAIEVIPKYWNKLYNSNFEDFEINYENLQNLTVVLSYSFTGHNSFQSFVKELLEKYKLKIPLNKILYGPPGTGKTYKTKKLAVEIIENVEYSDSKEDRDVILEKYESYVDSENVYFTTFHQSMSYEDFIEGIKPKMEEDEQVEMSYEVQDGIFKIICNKAKKNETLIENSGIEPFDVVWDKLINAVKQKLSNGELLKIGSWEYGLSSKESLKYESLNSPSKYTFTITKKNIYDTYQNKLARPSGAFQKDMKDILDFMKSQFELIDYEELDKNEDKHVNQNFVLIIDEINRGNVSAIFGELITLIEEDKRAGKKEAINITLPYSKLKFSVPSNVFIIGTMNTADRSVEALDTALRRRFSFEEVSPRPELLKNLEYQDVDLEKILDTINNRIELLIDKDHQIGHSYFFSINSLDDLKLVFKDKILPLLEEYFYGDFGKIGLVLGENFVEELKAQNKNILANFKSYDDIDFVSDKKIFRLKNIDEMTEKDFISIYENKK